MQKVMSIGKYAGFANEALKPFTEKLYDDYYSSIETLSDSARKQAEKVTSLETETTASEYALLCCTIIDEIKQHIRNRKETLIPYVHQLIEKSAANHDCKGCTGSCKLNHDLQVIDLTVSNEAAKKVLRRLQLATLPLYSQTMYPDEYRVLRNRMALIEMNMTELFFLEHSYLVPKIIEAQKTINAGNSGY
jgi:hypothetical protein